MGKKVLGRWVQEVEGVRVCDRDCAREGTGQDGV